ncbi:hypothetical protein B0H10DRAFT_1946075 [Mycena sp. CBHHK59/15]|nr:hypothetical protein B0H10DRAFT_1946075 [Mycena sp. CBHHK59/15]
MSGKKARPSGLEYSATIPNILQIWRVDLPGSGMELTALDGVADLLFDAAKNFGKTTTRGRNQVPMVSPGTTVAFRPKVHGVSPVTSIVHWVPLCRDYDEHINFDPALTMDSGRMRYRFALRGVTAAKGAVTWSVTFRIACHPPAIKLWMYWKFQMCSFSVSSGPIISGDGANES